MRSKIKGEGHLKVTATSNVVKEALRFLTHLRNAWTYFNETYQNYSLPGPHDTDDILKVMDSKVKVTDNFTGEGIPTDGLPLLFSIHSIHSGFIPTTHTMIRIVSADIIVRVQTSIGMFRGLTFF